MGQQFAPKHQSKAITLHAIKTQKCDIWLEDLTCSLLYLTMLGYNYFVQVTTSDNGLIRTECKKIYNVLVRESCF